MYTKAIICIIMLAALTVGIATKKINIPVLFTLVGFFGAFALGLTGNTMATTVKTSLLSTLLGTISFAIFVSIFVAILRRTGFFELANFYLYRLLLDGKTGTLPLYIFTLAVTGIFFLAGASLSAYLISFAMLKDIYDKVGVSKTRMVVLTYLWSATWLPLPWNVIGLFVSTAAGTDPSGTFQTAIPSMIGCGLGTIITAIIWSISDKKTHNEPFKDVVKDPRLAPEIPKEKRYNRFGVNLVLFAAMVFFLCKSTWMPTWLMVVFACAIALVANNYYNDADAGACFTAAGGTAMSLMSLLVPVTICVTVMTGSGAVSNLMELLLSIIPASIFQYAYLVFAVIIIVAFQAIPYQIYLALIPLLVSGVTAAGGSAYTVSALFTSILILGTCLSPSVSLTYVGQNASGVNYKECLPLHYKYGHLCLALAIIGSIIGQLI